MERPSSNMFFLNMAVVIFSLAALIPVYYQWVEADQQKQFSETYRQTEAGFRDFLANLQGIENLSYILARNPLYLEVSRLDSNYDSSCYVDVGKLRRYASELFFTHKGIMADFILTFHHSGIVITSNRVYLANSRMYPYYFKYPHYTEDEYRYMTQYTNGQVQLGKAMYTYTVENKLKKTMTLLIPLKVQGARNEVVLEILLDAEQLQESFFTPQPTSQGQTTLLNFENEPILATDYRYNDKNFYAEQTAPSQSIRVLEPPGKEKVVVFSMESSDSAYRLYSVRPMSEYSEEMKQILLLLAFYLLVALGISFIAALMNSIWQYKPTQLLAKILQQGKGECFRDDYRYLYSGMMQIQNEREHLTADIVQARERLDTLRFTQMLLEGSTADELAAKLPARCLCINFLSDGDHELLEESILKRFEPAGTRTVFRLAPKNLFLVLDIAVFSQQQATEAAKAALEAMNEPLFCGIVLAQGGEISAAYQQSVYVLHYRSAAAAAATERILVEHTAEITDSRNIFTENRKERLAGLLLSAQAFEADGLLYEIQADTEGHRPSRKALQYLYIGISDVLARVIVQRQLNVETVGVDEINLRQSVGQIFGRFRELVGFICQEILDKRKSANVGLREEIMHYIQENFTNPELYNGGIAEHFRISEKYLSEFFREQVGTSVGKYIEKQRMDYACKLILEGVLSMKEVGEKCGFGNQSTFYKSFNRVYGMSPKQYKTHE